MDKESLKNKRAAISKKEKKTERELNTLERQLVKKLCPKGKNECEPAYCTFRYTDTCPFLKKWREISKNY
jgi:hypothetical protein